MSPTPNSPSQKPPKKSRRRVWRLNLQAVVILTTILVVLGGGLAVLSLVKSGGRSFLVQAKQLSEKGQEDLALSYLNQFLEKPGISKTDRVEALELKAKILTRQARGVDQLRTAVKLGEQALRLAGEGPRTQDLRREQIKRILMLAPFMPPQANNTVDSQRSLYSTGDRLARDLIEHGDKSAEALRLRGQMLEGLAAGTNSNLLNQAIGVYEEARVLDPTDVEACTRLAVLYRDRKDDAQKGQEVLEELIKNAPKSELAWLALFQYQDEQGRRADAQGDRDEAQQIFDTARQTLDAALKLAPQDLNIHLAAAEFELARNRPEAARKLLDALSETNRQDPRAQALMGLSNLKQNHINEAIYVWRQGLNASNGTDANLTWRLAYILLSLGRLDDTSDLIEQYRRLTGSEEPTPRTEFLYALDRLKRNRPAEAIPILESIRLKADDDLLPLIYNTLGQCYEAVRNESAALEQYAKALDADPRLPGPRLARIRLLKGNPEEVEHELKKALDTQGEDPSLLLELARLELRKQNRKPANQQDWSNLKSITKRLETVAPGASGLLLLQADQLLVENKPEEALSLLEQATKLQKADPQVWLARAEMLRRTGQVNQAVLVLEQAMAPENAGDQASLRIAHAQLLTLQGHGQQAREDLVKNLDQVPADQRPEVWRALGALYTAQRDTEEARRAFAQWAEMLPNDPLPHLFLMERALAEDDREAADKQVEILKRISGERGIFWRIARAEERLRPVPDESEQARDGRLAEVEQIVEQIRTEAPQDSYAYLLKGQLLEARGQKEPAALAYEEALKHDGGSIALTKLMSLYTDLGRQADIDRLRSEYGSDVPTLDRALAESALQKGENDRAAELAAKAVETQPESVDTRLWQARLLIRIGRTDEAENTLQNLIEKQPTALQPRLALVTLRAEQGKKAEAAQAVDQIIQEVTDLKKPELTYAQCWRLVGDQKRADEAFQTALQKWPDDPEVIRLVADYEESSGRPEKAEALLDTYLKDHPDQRWAARGAALLRSNHPGDLAAWQSAWDLAQAAEGSQAELPEERLTRGIVLARSTDPENREKARSILSRLVLDLPAEYPSAAVARSMLVQIYLQAGQADKAVPVAAIDAEAQNASVQAVLRYVDILLTAKQTGKALRQLDRLSAGNLTVDLLRARILKADGQADKAAEVVRQTFANHKDDPNARKDARTILDGAVVIDPALGVEIARQIADTWPADLWLVASAQARQKGQASETMKLFFEAVPKADPDDLTSLVQNALALVTSSGQADPNLLAQAEKVVQAASERQPDSAPLLTMLGYVRHFQGRYADEVALYRQSLEKVPDNPDFLNNLAWALCEGLGQPREALPYIEQAFQVAAKAPEPRVPPQFFDTRGVIRTRLGETEKAVTDLEIAARTRPTGTVFAHLARAYHQAGQTEKFHAAVKQALDAKLTPDQLEPNERKDLVPLIFETDRTAAK
ncbi:MAG TPA: tetratricopeptide repeat protein [Isosphaeraceae bacterium]|nr:tetratricopeptide repeat protein [Isosphaeraceae bacterium]